MRCSGDAQMKILSFMELGERASPTIEQDLLPHHHADPLTLTPARRAEAPFPESHDVNRDFRSVATCCCVNARSIRRFFSRSPKHDGLIGYRGSGGFFA